MAAWRMTERQWIAKYGTPTAERMLYWRELALAYERQAEEIATRLGAAETEIRLLRHSLGERMQTKPTH